MLCKCAKLRHTHTHSRAQLLVVRGELWVYKIYVIIALRQVQARNKRGIYASLPISLQIDNQLNIHTQTHTYTHTRINVAQQLI